MLWGTWGPKYFVFYMPTLCVFLYFMYATENISYTNLNLCIPHTHEQERGTPGAMCGTRVAGRHLAHKAPR